MPNENEDSIQQLFREIISNSIPEKIVSNFVMVAELADSETTTLNIFMSDGMSPWLAQGMLQCAMEMVADNSPIDRD